MNSTPILCALVALSTGAASAAVKLPPFISSHMVLQRDIAVPIWGKADSGESVTVKFRDQQKQVTAAADGSWMIKLDPLKAGEPAVMTINGLTLEDVLVGEVWVGSGQSNMQMSSKAYLKGDPKLAANVAAGPYPKLRLASANKAWEVADPKSSAEFSALLFSFGLPLQQQLDVPVGLMVGAVGGTCSGYWISKQAFAEDPACQAAIASPEAMKKYEEDYARWKKIQDELEAKGKKAARGQNPPALKPGECGREMGFLYEAHIRPLQPYAIRGVLWDQGESGVNVGGVDQYTLMGALIKGWRNEWGQGEFPFLYVQKPSGGGCSWDDSTAIKPVDLKLPSRIPTGIGELEHYIRMMSYPNTAMVTCSDLGSGIHPPDKSRYGQRAAIVALAKVYGKEMEYYGPIYANRILGGGEVRVKFGHAGKGLAFKHGDKLQGFAIAGEDKVFHWADAKIEGDTVILTSAAVPDPREVRYAWSKTSPWANLFNQDGLPALPFRTDDW